MNRVNKSIKLAPVGAAALGILLGVTAVPQLANAKERNQLADEPAVRHRKLLVKKRFEATPLFESSINADYRHTFSFGVKLEYHLSDMISIGALGAFGIGVNTGLTNKIKDSLTDTSMNPTPSKAQFDEHINTMPIHAAAYASITPWYGKLAAFGKFFVNFDFYFQGGVAFASLKSECCSFATDPMPGGDPDNGIAGDDDPNNDKALNDGTRLGLYLGGGIHVFLNDWIALDLTVRNYMFNDNPSGLDFDADLAVEKEDDRFLNHLFMGVGISLFLPTTVKRTE